MAGQKIYKPFVLGAPNSWIVDAASIKGGVRVIAGEGPPSEDAVPSTQLVVGMLVSTSLDLKLWLWQGDGWVELPALPGPPPEFTFQVPLVLVVSPSGDLLWAQITSDMVLDPFGLLSISTGISSPREIGGDLNSPTININANRPPVSGWAGAEVPPTAYLGFSQTPETTQISGPFYNSVTLPDTYTAPTSLPAANWSWTVYMADAGQTPQNVGASLLWAALIKSGANSTVVFTPDGPPLWEDNFDGETLDPNWVIITPPDVPPNSGPQLVGDFWGLLDGQLLYQFSLSPFSGTGMLFLASITAPYQAPPAFNDLPGYEGEGGAGYPIDLTGVSSDLALSFQVAGFTNDEFTYVQFKVRIYNVTLDQTTEILNTFVNNELGPEWNYYQLDLSAFAGYNIVIRFIAADDRVGSDPYAVFIDDVKLETGTWASGSPTIDADFIQNTLTLSDLETDRSNYQRSITAGSGEFTYFAYPAFWDDFLGPPTFLLDFGFADVTQVAANVPLTNQYGLLLLYNVYRSVDTDLSGNWIIF